MASCILHQNADQTITLLDIPRSIEHAQSFQKHVIKRLVSSEAIEQPFASVEPKSAKALKNVKAATVRSILLERFITLALEEVRTAFEGAWCFPRVTKDILNQKSEALNRHLYGISDVAPVHASTGVLAAESNSTGNKTHNSSGSHCDALKNFTPDVVYHNDKPIVMLFQVLGFMQRTAYIPPLSSFLAGDIENTLATFNHTASEFNLIVLDPPWPNRSARRKQSYNISANTSAVAILLSSIPLARHLAKDALVGIWVTNKSAIHDLILGTNGLFDSWGLELVEEWVWLKVTTSGVPICALDSSWRKPYEILLIGKKGGSVTIEAEFKRRVIIAVPDLHSRKPNLKELFEPMMPSKYEALELFARNLTAGWWAWGNEVLKFQGDEHWLDISNDT